MIAPNNTFTTDPDRSDRPHKLHNAISDSAASSQFVTLPLDLVEESPQHREFFDEPSLRLFAAELVERGQLQPIGVRFVEATGKYSTAWGARRVRALRIAGAETVQALILPPSLTDEEVLCVQLSENLHRAELQPLERARAFQALKNLKRLTGKELADFLNVDPATVSRSLDLLRQPQDVRQQIEAGLISATKALKQGKEKRKPAKAPKSKKLKVSRGITFVVQSRKPLADADVVAALRELLAKLEAATPEEVPSC